MQKIVHEKGYRAIHPIFDELEKFYALTSTKALQRPTSLIPERFDDSFESLQGIFNIYGGNQYSFKFTNKHFKPLELPKYNDKNIILGFSGGKDSTATAVHYIEQGYNVYLYHVRGLNRQYPDEWKSAEEIAEYLGRPIYIEQVSLDGKLDFIEHPMKNMIIASGALQYGIKNNIGTTIAFGNYYDSYLVDTPFYIAGDDCVDMWEPYEEIIQRIIPNFQIEMALQNFNDTLEILEKDKKLLGLCKSCLGAYRFREYNHKKNEEKYKIKLLPHRCGSCWKCAAEYIYMTDHNVLEYSEEYYKHCLDILRKTNKKENDTDFTTVRNLWADYFAYDMKESKYKEISTYGVK